MIAPTVITRTFLRKNSFWSKADIYLCWPGIGWLHKRGVAVCPTRLFLLLAVTAGTLLVKSEPSAAQQFRSFTIDSVAAYLESSTFSDRIERRWTSSRPLLQDNEYGFTEGLSLNLTGSVYHPRFLTWSSGGRFTFKQRFLSTQAPGSSRDIFEGLKEYSLYTLLFKDHPISLGLSATRNIAGIDGNFLEAINVKKGSTSGNISWNTNNLFQIIDYRRTYYVSEGQIRNDEIRKTLSYDATLHLSRFNGNAQYEFNDNNFLTYQRSIIGHYARLTGRLALDQKGGRTITTSLLYNRQKSQITNRYVEGSVSTNLALSHSLDAAMFYSYRNDRVDSVRSHLHTGTVSLVHRLYKSLTTALEGEGRVTKYDDGKQTDLSPSLRVSYRKQTFFGHFTLFYNLAYRRYQEDFERMTRRLQERTTTYLVGSPITLTEPNIDTSSIEIVNLSRPAQIPQKGIDFVIQVMGNYPEIVIPLTSSIQNGDSLQIRYLMYSQDIYEFEESTRHYGIGLGVFSFVNFRADHRESNRSLIAGTPVNPLEDVEVDNLNLSIRYKEFRLEGQYQLRQTTITPYKRRGVLARFTRPFSQKLNLLLSTSYIVTDFTDVKERSKSVNLAGSIWYQPWRDLTFESQLNNINRSGRNDDGHDFVLSSTARYTRQKIQVELHLNIYDRKITVAGTEDRTVVRLSLKRTL